MWMQSFLKNILENSHYRRGKRISNRSLLIVLFLSYTLSLTAEKIAFHVFLWVQSAVALKVNCYGLQME